MNDNGYIKLYRSFLSWEWIDNPKTLKVWIYILLSANWEDGIHNGNVVPAGSFVRSLDNIAKEIRLTKDEVRTAIKHLKQTGEISTTNFPRKTFLITVENWGKYQGKMVELNENCTRTSHDFPTDIRSKEDKNKELSISNNSLTINNKEKEINKEKESFGVKTFNGRDYVRREGGGKPSSIANILGDIKHTLGMEDSNG